MREIYNNTNQMKNFEGNSHSIQIMEIEVGKWRSHQKKTSKEKPQTGPSRRQAEPAAKLTERWSFSKPLNMLNRWRSKERLTASTTPSSPHP